MTETEWSICDNPLPMLIFLRGDVPEDERSTFHRQLISNFGTLYDGSELRVSDHECRLLIDTCSRRLAELHLDCRGSLSAFWTNNPIGVANAFSDVAWTVANKMAESSLAISCAHATDDDWFAWSFCGGPPDSTWQSIRAVEEQRQATILREIVGNPFQS